MNIFRSFVSLAIECACNSQLYFKFIAGLLILSVLLTTTTTTNGAKILAVYPFSGRSHFQMTQVIIKEVTQHGHEVTMITGRTLEPLKLGKNYTEILIEPEFDYWKHIHKNMGTSNVSDIREDVKFLVKMAEYLGMGVTEHALQQPKIQAIINAKQTKGVYDLLLIEEFAQDALLAFAHIYDVPVISTATFAQQNYMSEMFGMIAPWSYVPLGMTTFTQRMSFWERVQNTYYSLQFDFHRKFSYLPNMDALMKKYFGHLTIDFPSTSAMTKNLSAILINSYTPLALPSPKMDNMINVGGMHIYPNKSLPSDIQKFLDEAEDGVIYFSLGSQIQSKDLPQEKLNIFLDVFRNIKQRILWKFESDSLKNLPINIMIKPWMPQTDILAHPNVRAFIAHGGIFGTQEAIYYGVPVVGIPFFFDQFLNVKQGHVAGYTEPLNIQTLTHDDLKNALHKVCYNGTFRDNMKRMSRIFRDRPVGPRETAIYWIEYVIRHKGARHLRAAGMDLKWYQFYLLDVIAFLAAVLALSIACAVMTVRWIWRRFKGMEAKQKLQKDLVVAISALIALLTQIHTTNGAKILAVYAAAGRSHFQMHRVIIKELVKHGHEVTMITAETLKPLNLGKNYTEILIEPELDIWELLFEETGKTTTLQFSGDPKAVLTTVNIFGRATTEHALKQPKIQAIINANQTKGVYDLLIVEQLFQDAFLALAHIYDIPVISTCTFAQAPFMTQMFGFISPLSYVPFNFMPFTDHMTFWERVKNTYYTLKFDLDREYRYFPGMDELVKKYFGHLSIDFPTTSAMSRNLSAMLINNYTPLVLPGPKMENMVNVGGMHIYPNKSLPNDIQKFLDEAEHGAIYFSFGTHVLGKELPQEKLQIFLDVFRNIKQRVLWKFENDSLLTNVPNNVMIKSWMPQNDILPHPNLRAFISHGGLFGSQEAVHYGVPVVGIPFMFDQNVNLKIGERFGYTIPLNIHTLTREDLKNALHKVCYDVSFRENMKRMSQAFRDRPMGPRETAIYWIEYVIRHKGARHLRAAGLDLKWYQFYLLDVVAFFAAAVTVPLAIALMVVWWFWQRCKKDAAKQKVH
ncbi:uncharacterized protein [Eurosta solidaginis]|uniref:uncharacterized protein n=1 Tax=Eurosta solidaginis TaxID=178769 RepID=UPI003530D58A